MLWKKRYFYNIGILNGEILSFIDMPKIKLIGFSSEKEENDITNSQKLLRYINKYLTNPDLTIIYRSLDSVTSFDNSFLTRIKFKKLDCNLGQKKSKKTHQKNFILSY